LKCRWGGVYNRARARARLAGREKLTVFEGFAMKRESRGSACSVRPSARAPRRK
jgi:hypothetical protein